MGIQRIFFTALLANQAVQSAKAIVEKNIAFREAFYTAEQSGKPLLVIGGPYGSGSNRLFHFPAHPCGDVCLDIEPASCSGCPEVEISDIRQIPYAHGYFGAAFASHVVEHLPTAGDALMALDEMQRVADYIFVVSPRKANIVSWIVPSHHLWVWQGYDGSIYISERRNGGIMVKWPD